MLAREPSSTRASLNNFEKFTETFRSMLSNILRRIACAEVYLRLCV